MSEVPKFPYRRKFQKWLAEKPKSEVVSEDWNGCSCPLAQFLTDELGDEWYVSPSLSDARGAFGIYRPSIPGETRLKELPKLPRWANDFAHQIDKFAASCATEEGKTFAPVTSEICLNILAQVRL